jgi:hypothetical protein
MTPFTVDQPATNFDTLTGHHKHNRKAYIDTCLELDSSPTTAALKLAKIFRALYLRSTLKGVNHFLFSKSPSTQRFAFHQNNISALRKHNPSSDQVS